MHPTQNGISLTGEYAAKLYQKTECGGRIARADRTFWRILHENKVYQTPTELWIASNSHAKSILRHAGATETFVEGAGSDFEKFRFFCTVMGDSVANPLQTECNLALRTLFDCPLALGEGTCEEIWHTVCEKMARENLTPREYVKRSGVDTVLVPMAPWETTDGMGACDTIYTHPVFSPDVYFLPNGKDFVAAVRELGEEIEDLKQFSVALLSSLDRFAASGCRVASQSVLPAEFRRPNEYHAALYFKKALSGEVLEGEELALYQAQLWRILVEAYAKRDMTLELRVGQTPEKTAKSYTVCGDISIKAVKALLDYLKERVGLSRIAVYVEEASLIPDVAALVGQYSALDEGVPQIALGVWQGAPANTRAQLRALASALSLSTCVGALPDARLPLSPHTPALFHRVLCAELADWEAHGEICAGEENLCRVVERLTGENMRKYYKL